MQPPQESRALLVSKHYSSAEIESMSSRMSNLVSFMLRSRDGTSSETVRAVHVDTVLGHELLPLAVKLGSLGLGRMDVELNRLAWIASIGWVLQKRCPCYR